MSKYWDDVRDQGLFGYGYGAKKFKDVSAGEHFSRARTFAFGGSGALRQESLNALGVITKQQMKFAQTSKLAKLMTAGIPLFGAYMMSQQANNGEQFGTYLTETTALHSGAFYGGRLGANLGAGLQKRAGGTGFAGRFYGGALGTVAGGAIAYGIASTLQGAVSANNSVQTLKKKMYEPDLYRDILQNKNTLTHRQAALAAISKSGMNNRGQLMGNEAQVLYGS